MRKLFRPIWLLLLIASSTVALAVQHTATIKVEPADFNVDVYCDGNFLGTVRDEERSFEVDVPWGPSLIRVESSKFKTFYSSTRNISPDQTVTVSNIHYTDAYKAVAFDTAKDDGDGDMDGEEPSQSSFIDRYPNTLTFWEKVIEVNKEANDSLKEQGSFNLGGALPTERELLDAYNHIDREGVDPLLLAAFDKMVSDYADMISSEELVKDGWIDLFVGALDATLTSKFANDNSEWLQVPGLLPQIVNAGDVYTATRMSFESRFDQLQTVLTIMEYRYGNREHPSDGPFDTIYVALFDCSDLVSRSGRMQGWLDSE